MIAPSPDHIVRAVILIRRMRGADAKDGYPNDLGCETQLYLGAAIQLEYPALKMGAVADLCGVGGADAIFFAELLDIADRGGWMREDVITGAMDCMAGRPVAAKWVTPNLTRATA